MSRSDLQYCAWFKTLDQFTFVDKLHPKAHKRRNILVQGYWSLRVCSRVLRSRVGWSSSAVHMPTSPKYCKVSRWHIYTRLHVAHLYVCHSARYKDVDANKSQNSFTFSSCKTLWAFFAWSTDFCSTLKEFLRCSLFHWEITATDNSYHSTNIIYIMNITQNVYNKQGGKKKQAIEKGRKEQRSRWQGQEKLTK